MSATEILANLKAGGVKVEKGDPTGFALFKLQEVERKHDVVFSRSIDDSGDIWWTAHHRGQWAALQVIGSDDQCDIESIRESDGPLWMVVWALCESTDRHFMEQSRV